MKIFLSIVILVSFFAVAYFFQRVSVAFALTMLAVYFMGKEVNRKNIE